MRQIKAWSQGAAHVLMVVLQYEGYTATVLDETVSTDAQVSAIQAAMRTIDPDCEGQCYRLV